MTIKDFSKADWDRLFPIQLIEHDINWRNLFQKEKENIIHATAGQSILRIEHFGSSSIPDIKSKPYIDILIEVYKEHLFDPSLIQSLKRIGYTCLTEPNEDPNNYMILCKGYHTDGTYDQVFHIHMCDSNHDMMKQLKFRDILMGDPQKARAYEQLKLKLAQEYTNDRSGYRLAKSDFIKKILEKAE